MPLRRGFTQRGSVKPVRPADAAPARDRWFGQPIAWLAVLLLCASLAGVAVTIVVAQRHPDEPLRVDGARVLKAPVARPDDPASPTDPDEPE